MRATHAKLIAPSVCKTCTVSTSKSWHSLAGQPRKQNIKCNMSSQVIEARFPSHYKINNKTMIVASLGNDHSLDEVGIAVSKCILESADL